MVKLNTAEIEFIAKDLASKVIAKIEAQTKKLGKTTETESNKMGKAFDKLGSVAQTAIGFSIGSLAADAVRAINNEFVNATKRALEFEVQLQSLEIQTGNTANVLLSELQIATKGLVSDLDLAKSANKALALGLQRDTLPALAQTAVALGKLTGRSATEAFNDITIGIGRASPLILDNLGIIIDADATYKTYADSIGKSVDQLSKLDKTTALTNRTIESNIALVTAQNALQEANIDILQRFKAELDNVTTGYVKSAIEGLNSLTAEIVGVKKSLLDNSEVFQKASADVETYSTKIIDANKDINSFQQQVNELNKTIQQTLTGNINTADDLKITAQIAKLERERAELKPAKSGSVEERKIAQQNYEIAVSKKDVQIEQLRQQLDLNSAKEKEFQTEETLNQIYDENGKFVSEVAKNYGIIAENLDSVKQNYIDSKKEIDTLKDKQKLLNDVINAPENGYLALLNKAKQAREDELATLKQISDEIRVQNSLQGNKQSQYSQSSSYFPVTPQDVFNNVNTPQNIFNGNGLIE